MLQRERAFKTKFLLLIAFVSGLSIMAMEISAARLLAPYFGISIFVWTNVIGVVLAALSLGYYVGGKLADRHPRLDVLLGLIFAAGVFFLAVPWMAGPLASWITIHPVVLESASIIIFVSSLVVTLVLFALPLVVLGMVSPFIIKLYSLSNSQTGEVAGSVFAVSTLGSILGTFLPTLWLIPLFGTKGTISIFAAALIAMAGFGLIGKKLYIALTLILISVLVFQIRHTNVLSAGTASETLFEGESAFQYIRVLQDFEGNRYLVFNEGRGVQSLYSPRSVLTADIGGIYYDSFNVLPYIVGSDKKKQVLILGLAGGTISRQMDYFFRGKLVIDGVEIDKKVIKVAEKYFDLRNPSLTVYNQDGRMFLKNAPKKYNIIIIDAYTRELYIPWTLTTEEFWRLVDKKLSKGGVVAINVDASSQNSALLKAIANTMASIFRYSYVVRIEGKRSLNYMILASRNELPLKHLPELVDNPELASVAKLVAANAAPFQYSPAELVLTDDRAPVEFMTAQIFYPFSPKPFSYQ